MFSQGFNEIFDVVDREDSIIGQASRKLVHEEGLIHRSVHILVFNFENQLFLQKRSLEKDENPGLWDSSASGHVVSGENYYTSASRELFEELGIKEKIDFWIKLSASEKTLWEHVSVYKCISNKEMTLDTSEIIEGSFWNIKELERAMNIKSEKFTSTLRIIFERLNEQKIQ